MYDINNNNNDNKNDASPPPCQNWCPSVRKCLNSPLVCTVTTYSVLWSMRNLLWLVLGWSVYRPGNGLRGWWVWPPHGCGVPDGSFDAANTHPAAGCGCRNGVCPFIRGPYCLCADVWISLVCLCMRVKLIACVLCNQSIYSNRSNNKLLLRAVACEIVKYIGVQQCVCEK